MASLHLNPHPLRNAGDVWRRWGGSIIGVAVVALLAAALWYLLSDMASTKREVASTPMLMLPPPPPPPPEPEKLPDPEPVKPVVTEVKPTPAEPVEKPSEDTPSPAKDLSDPVTMNSDAQAGNDSFGIQSGRGGGMTGGGGLGGGSYNNYVSNFLQQILLRDPRTRSLSFDGLTIDLWMAADGRTTRLQLVKSSGNAQTDELILATLRGVERIDEQPPPSMRLPMRLSMRGRRQ